MPPVNTSASPSDVDNEATAELPVLDVAAYESTLSDPIAHTDTWVLPTGALTQMAPADGCGSGGPKSGARARNASRRTSGNDRSGP